MDAGFTALLGEWIDTGVIATGRETEIGRIGKMVSRVEGVTTPPLRKIDTFGKQLSVAIVLGSVGVFLFGWWRRRRPWAAGG